jgi:uncharacterized LabA/DUF88 family protein
MNPKRCIVLIDGSNFYFKLKKLGLHQLSDVNMTKFLQQLTLGFTHIHTIYYVGKIRTDGTPKTQKMFNNQRKLLAHLHKHNIRYSLGYLLKSDGAYHEKGVDIHMAVDILVATYEDLCDHIILLSSDTDLLPAIKKAQEKGKTIEYIGFSHQPSHAMKANCFKTRLLDKKDIIPHMKNPVKTD